MMRIEIIAGTIEIEMGDSGVVAIEGPAPLERLPHIARSYLEGEELAFFESVMGMGFGCAGVIVRDVKKDADLPSVPEETED